MRACLVFVGFACGCYSSVYSLSDEDGELDVAEVGDRSRTEDRVDGRDGDGPPDVDAGFPDGVADALEVPGSDADGDGDADPTDADAADGWDPDVPPVCAPVGDPVGRLEYSGSSSRSGALTVLSHHGPSDRGTCLLEVVWDDDGTVDLFLYETPWSAEPCLPLEVGSRWTAVVRVSAPEALVAFTSGERLVALHVGEWDLARPGDLGSWAVEAISTPCETWFDSCGERRPGAVRVLAPDGATVGPVFAGDELSSDSCCGRVRLTVGACEEYLEYPSCAPHGLQWVEYVLQVGDPG